VRGRIGEIWERYGGRGRTHSTQLATLGLMEGAFTMALFDTVVIALALLSLVCMCKPTKMGNAHEEGHRM
jgi:hypothetical protein